MNVIVSSDWHIPPESFEAKDFQFKNPDEREESSRWLKRWREHLDPHIEYVEKRLAEPDTLVVLAGDIFDTLDFGIEAYKRPNYVHPVLQRLITWQSQYPDRLHILEGNHDPATKGFLQVESEVVISNILISHGFQYDRYGWKYRPFRWLVGKLAQLAKPRGKKKNPIMRFVHRFFRPPAKRKISSLMKGKMQDYQKSTTNAELEAGMRALKKSHRAVVFGHTHMPMIVERDWTFNVGNCGDWVDSFTFLELDIGHDPVSMRIDHHP